MISLCKVLAPAKQLSLNVMPMALIRDVTGSTEYLATFSLHTFGAQSQSAIKDGS